MGRGRYRFLCPYWNGDHSVIPGGSDLERTWVGIVLFGSLDMVDVEKVLEKQMVKYFAVCLLNLQRTKRSGRGCGRSEDNAAARKQI